MEPFLNRRFLLGLNRDPIVSLAVPSPKPKETSLTWLTLIVIVLTVIYVLVIFRKYTDVVQETRPYIDEAIGRNENLKDGIRAAKEVLRDVVEKVKDVELVMNDLKIGLAKVEEDIAQQAAEEEKLELAQ